MLRNFAPRGLSPSLCRIFLPKMTDQSLKVVFDSFPSTPNYLCTIVHANDADMNFYEVSE